MVSIADKIKKEVGNPDDSRFAWTGTRHGDFKLMHKAVQCLKLCESHAAIAPESYTPILHEWEVRAAACLYSQCIYLAWQWLCKRQASVM